MCQRKYVQKLSEQRKTRKLFETLTFLEKQMEDESAVRDADTVLADILEGADFEITGIVTDLLKTYQGSKHSQWKPVRSINRGNDTRVSKKVYHHDSQPEKRRGFKSKKVHALSGIAFFTCGEKGGAKRRNLSFP